jgi:hypothetical protein
MEPECGHETNQYRGRLHAIYDFVLELNDKSATSSAQLGEEIVFATMMIHACEQHKKMNCSHTTDTCKCLNKRGARGSMI